MMKFMFWAELFGSVAKFDTVYLPAALELTSC